MRLTAPVPGMLNVYAHEMGEDKAMVGVRAYLFSPDAAEYVEREQPAWQERLFIWLSRKSEDATEYFKIPTDRVVEVGTQVQV